MHLLILCTHMHIRIYVYIQIEGIFLCAGGELWIVCPWSQPTRYLLPPLTGILWRNVQRATQTLLRQQHNWCLYSHAAIRWRWCVMVMHHHEWRRLQQHFFFIFFLQRSCFRIFIMFVLIFGYEELRLCAKILVSAIIFVFLWVSLMIEFSYLAELQGLTD